VAKSAEGPPPIVDFKTNLRRKWNTGVRSELKRGLSKHLTALKRELRAYGLRDRSRFSSNLPARSGFIASLRKKRERPSTLTEETKMAWTTPEIVEVCVGMEITSYSSAEI
jgi:coenzyme PQQ precursor peptide PqqA